jgi:mannose-1-phosphate guanylyltransferase
MLGQYYAVIMAGGGGTRLWPLSRKANPKQSLSLFGKRTLFQIAVDRLDGLFSADKILVVTIADQAEQLHMQVPQIPVKNFLIEPMPRGTASVVAMAAAAIQKRDPQGVMAVLTADHYIEGVSAFQTALKAAKTVSEQGLLVTLGVPPAFAGTGYGYLERGAKLCPDEGFDVYELKAFKEKPSEQVAKEFLAHGGYYWNSGMFIWKVEVILQKFKELMPDLYEKLQTLQFEIGVDHSSVHFREVWGSIVPETIDYGIMEKSDRCAVLPVGDIGWSDVGSWDSLFDVIKPDSNGNILINATHVGFNTSNSLIYSSDPGRLLVTIGMQDVIIVDTGDAVLICPRGQSQKVKDLVAYLKDHQLTPFL